MPGHLYDFPFDRILIRRNNALALRQVTHANSIAKDRNRHHGRHALGDTLLPFPRDEIGSARHVGPLFQGRVGRQRVLPVGDLQTPDGGRRPECVATRRA
jgi:hypothetical protein